MPTLNDRFTSLSHVHQRNTKRKRIHSSPPFNDFANYTPDYDNYDNYNNPTDDYDDNVDDYDDHVDDNYANDNYAADDFRNNYHNSGISRIPYGRSPKVHKSFKVVPRRKPCHLTPASQPTRRLTVKKRSGPTITRRNQDTQRAKPVVKKRTNTLVKKRSKPVVTLTGDDAYQGRGRRRSRVDQTYLDAMSRLISKDDLDKELDDYYGVNSSLTGLNKEMDNYMSNKKGGMRKSKLIRKNPRLDLASAGQPIAR